MTDVREASQDIPAPELLERGRYALTLMADGSWVVTRAANICETCQGCGCGEQQEPIPIPAMVVPFLTGQAELSPSGAMKLFKGMMGNGK